ncbi:MAG: dTDP-4-dehydrorhamnose reductase [Solirubrobacterales bacterium]|nr:dTDP-4-dehydrorhamnose reductase [Solirubrobacterales bacterium]MBV9471648.1 dTDP-4-dehydrorhamnose reductase [Solirubrobacterales bacterium]
MRIVITGAAGMLGQDLRSAASAAGHEVLALVRAELDITDPDAVQRQLAQARPEVVINCAAWTDVDGAEGDYPGAVAVNGAGAGNVARAAAAAGAWTLHVSSDYVFDGAKREPYLESDPVAPLSAYGRSKLEGELAVARAAPGRHTIVRSSWLFGNGGPCFPATILRLAAERDELTVVEDQVGCPTFTGHLAPALVDLAWSAGSAVEGIMHVAGAGACSWYELAREIVARAGLECRVHPGTTEEMARPAPRPAYSVLGTERGHTAPRLPHWRQGLGEFLAAEVPAR